LSRGRSRLIQPQFFVNDRINNLPIEARLFFIGMWTLADREGRLKDRPRMLKVQLLPFDDVDGEKVINSLSTGGFITRYTVNDDAYIQINGWHENQSIHHREKVSEIPDLNHASAKHARSMAEPRLKHGPSKAEEPEVEVEVEEEVEAEVEVVNPSPPIVRSIQKNRKKILNTPQRGGSETMQNFEQFMAVYPKKRGRLAAYRVWAEMKLDHLTETIVKAVQNQIENDHWDGPKFIPNPQKWLADGSWDDAVEKKNPFDKYA